MTDVCLEMTDVRLEMTDVCLKMTDVCLEMTDVVVFLQALVEVVDIDPEVVTVAKDWFGFAEDARMTVHVADGIQYLRDSRTQGKSWGFLRGSL